MEHESNTDNSQNSGNNSKEPEKENGGSGNLWKDLNDLDYSTVGTEYNMEKSPEIQRIFAVI